MHCQTARLRVLIHETHQLYEHRARDGLYSEKIREHHRPGCMLEHDHVTRHQVAKELGSTQNVLRLLECHCCFALDRLQWVRNGLTLTTADDYNSKVLSVRGGARPTCRLYNEIAARGPHPTESPRITGSKAMPQGA